MVRRLQTVLSEESGVFYERDTAAVGVFFSEQISRVTTTFFHCEFLQEFRQPGDDSFELFQARKYDAALASLATELQTDGRIYDSLGDRGASATRVRAYQLPLSEYLCHYEIPSYFVSMSLGERIKVVDIKRLGKEVMQQDPIDFLLFDSSALIVPDYDETGLRSGSWISEDRSVCAIFRELANRLELESEPLTEELFKQLLLAG